MKRKIFSFIIFLLLPLMFVAQIRADYILPYPSYMPGHKLYRLSRIIDDLKGWWYWGNIGKTKYHMALSDKYLVEAKTLFEYKQYILALDALYRSNIEFSKIKIILTVALRDKINISQVEARVYENALVQRVIIKRLEQQLPAEFTWNEEKKNAVVLPVFQLLEEAYHLRLLSTN